MNIKFINLHGYYEQIFKKIFFKYPERKLIYYLHNLQKTLWLSKQLF